MRAIQNVLPKRRLYTILPLLALVVFMPVAMGETETEDLPNQDLFYEPGNPNRPVTMGELDAIHNDLTRQINQMRNDITTNQGQQNAIISENHKEIVGILSSHFKAVFEQFGNIVHVLITGEAPPYIPAAATPTPTHP